ncbi:hypothetical protein M0802_000576 [Mischocyttarus mexicanus]|nr:hypothetical protein M0802_000576 [Mischocyttarus mexicanus]
MCFEEERTLHAAVEVVSPSTTEALTKGAIDPNPIKMSKITLLLFVVALTLCIAVQFISAAPTLQENEEGQLAGCGHQAAHCQKNSDCCFYLKCHSYAKLCMP